MTGIWRLRAAVLLLAGTLGVHRGRYLFASADHEHHLSAAHAYLPWLTPLAGVLVFLAAAQLTVGLGRADGERARLPGGRGLWLGSVACLLTVFLAQESLETLFAHGYLPALGELLADGGWTAVPFAAAAGGAVALVLRGAHSVVSWALRRGSRPAARVAALPVPPPPCPVLGAPRCVLARRLAGRAPPRASLST